MLTAFPPLLSSTFPILCSRFRKRWEDLRWEKLQCQQDSRKEERAISWVGRVAARRSLWWFPSLHAALSGGKMRTASHPKTKLQNRALVTARARPEPRSLRPGHLRASSVLFPSLVQLSAHTYWVTSSLIDSFQCYFSVRERKISPCSSFLPTPCLDPSYTPVLAVSNTPNNVCLLPQHLYVNW